jgi:hypothetical protein
VRAIGRRTATAAAAGGVLLVVAFVTYHLFDYRVFWEAGRHVLHGTSPYPSDAALARATRDYYVYPPLAAVALAPLSLLPFGVAGVAYTGLSVAALVATLRVLDVRDARCYVVLLLWMPVLQAVALGTVAPFLALATALAWRYRDQVVVGAAAVGVAIAAKIFLWPLVVWLVATRRFRRAAEACAVGVVAVVLPWAALGFTDLRRYPLILQRLFSAEGETSWSPTSLGHLAGVGWAVPAAELAALAVVVVLAGRRDGDRRAFAAAVAASLVLSPIVWMHYLVVLVVPIALSSRRLSAAWLLPALAFWPLTDTHRLLGVGLWVDAVAVGVVLLTLKTKPQLEVQRSVRRLIGLPSIAAISSPSPKV